LMFGCIIVIGARYLDIFFCYLAT
jgi:hypothetical protein